MLKKWIEFFSDCHTRIILILTFCFFSLNSIHAQEAADTTKKNCVQKDVRDLLKRKHLGDSIKIVQKKKYEILVVPVLSSSPATGFIIGVAGQIAFTGKSPESRMSLISANANYTTKNQTQILMKNNVYLKNNRIFLSGDWKLLLYSQTTYGLGTNAPGYPIKTLFGANGVDISDDSLAQPMLYNYIKLHQTASFAVNENLFIGGGIHFDNYYDIEDQKLDTATGHYTSHYIYSVYHGFDPTKYKIIGLSANFVYDSRDNLINAYKGVFANLNFRLNPNILGGDSQFSMATAEFRSYHSVSKNNPRNVIALWFYGNYMSRGSVPYMILPALGYDQKNMTGRGYSQGRFRGQDLMYAESEFRFNISPCTKILGGVLFATAITTSNRDADVKLFEYIKPTVGFGLRIMCLKESRTNLQIDFGYGQNSSGVYFGATEAF